MKNADSRVWHIVSGEYPPQPGGVSDYTFHLAVMLADAGDEVHIWTPDAPVTTNARITVHRLPGHFGPSALGILGRALKAEKRPFRFLVQYVPHMYGMRNMNVFLAYWLWKRRPVAPWVMFHEVAFPIVKGQPLKHRFLAHVQRTMARWVARGMARGFVSVPSFAKTVQTLAPDSPPCEWLPIPSNMPQTANAARVAAIRQQIAPDRAHRVIGHFGTFGGYIADALLQTLPYLAQREPDWRFLLIGRNSDQFAESLLAQSPELKNRLFATGSVDGESVSEHLMASDVLYQPYQDGISARRGSAMAGLALGLPIVTHSGQATEPVWTTDQLVHFAPPGSPAATHAALALFAHQSPEREALATRARLGYDAHFKWDRIAALLRA